MPRLPTLPGSSRFKVSCLLILLAWTAPHAAADDNSTHALYTPAPGTSPVDQGWDFFSVPGGAVLAADASGTGLDTTHNPAEIAGWIRQSPVPFVPASTITLDLTLQIHAESHTSDDRAGFSLLVLREDLSGIELGFWSDQVWAQSDSPLFTRAESAPQDTTQAREWSLVLTPHTYTLSVDDQPALTGPLRDYSAFEGPINPYRTPNLLFIGDNTRSAAAHVHVGAIHLRLPPPPSVPGQLRWQSTPEGFLLEWDPQPGLLLEEADGDWTHPDAWVAPDPNPGPQGRHLTGAADGNGARWFRLRHP